MWLCGPQKCSADSALAKEHTHACPLMSICCAAHVCVHPLASYRADCLDLGPAAAAPHTGANSPESFLEASDFTTKRGVVQLSGVPPRFWVTRLARSDLIQLRPAASSDVLAPRANLLTPVRRLWHHPAVCAQPDDRLLRVTGGRRSHTL